MPKTTFFNLSPDKRQRIMDAAIKEFSRAPIEHVNVSNIVRDSGISRGSFYQYFHDKDDLYTHFFSTIGQVKMTYFGTLFDARHDMPFIDRLYQMHLKGIAFRLDYPEFVPPSRMLLQSNDPKTKAMIKDSTRQGIDLFEAMIRQDQVKGRISSDVDSWVLAAITITFMNTFSMEDYLQDDLDPDTIKEKVKALIHIFKKGITDHVHR
ncbi:MAG: TetR/AcrR family transcriptional regulator [Acholeplasmataceae bacterium]|nr:MAG: TetR/AcrR family transcriptional regulator [Acholeplasmataceae bacterium]